MEKLTPKQLKDSRYRNREPVRKLALKNGTPEKRGEAHESDLNKQLLDEVFVISRIIKVEVKVISRSQRFLALPLISHMFTGMLPSQL